MNVFETFVCKHHCALGQTKDIVQTLTDNGSFKTLINALKAADVLGTLNGTGPFTLFAPNDEAFAKIPDATLTDLLQPKNKEQLAKILAYHVIGGRLTAANISGMALPMQIGLPTKTGPIIDKTGTAIKVNDATVITADVAASNGIIHILDTVAMLPTHILVTLNNMSTFTNLAGVLVLADLTATLRGPGVFTIFAPNDAAFQKLPQDVYSILKKSENKAILSKVLQYHLVGQLITAPSISRMTLPANVLMLAGGTTTVTKDGNTIKINDATVTKADVFNTNGMIHVVDTVIMPPFDLVDTAILKGNFAKFIDALKTANLLSTLKGTGPFTIFAPTDAAFAKLPADIAHDLSQLQDGSSLVKILKYHIINGRVMSANISATNPPANTTMLSGGTAMLGKKGDIVQINEANVVTPDIVSTNGIIHAIDTVILPPLDIVETAIIKGNFDTFVGILTAAELVVTLRGKGPFTVFAPTDDAFKKLPDAVVTQLSQSINKELAVKILKYHVTNVRLMSADINAMSLPANAIMLSGGTAILSKNGATIRIDSANVGTADVVSTNGIIHAIDTVILPPLDILETATMQGNLNTFLTAVRAANLSATLKGNGPFTIFAPTDAAFDKLPKAVVEELIKPENSASLARILRYHVVTSRLTSGDVDKMVPNGSISMSAGGTAKLSKNETAILINEARIVKPDVASSNGIIHVIDTVILPPLDVIDTAIMQGNLKTLVRALEAADLLSTLKTSAALTIFAPTDDAFAKLPAEVINDLLKPENKDTLARILKYHVVNKRLVSGDISAMKPANETMLAGIPALLSKNGTTVQINNAIVTKPDIASSNGVIHTIDTVILPSLDIVETAIIRGNFKLLIDALRKADLVTVLRGKGPFTLFAPNDATIASLPSGSWEYYFIPENRAALVNTLKYHVLDRSATVADLTALGFPNRTNTLLGQTLTIDQDKNSIKVNYATVTLANVPSSNGVIHVVDNVLQLLTTVAQPMMKNDQFKTLASALAAAGLNATLQGPGPFTIFAPTEAAFMKLQPDIRDELLKAENKETLSKILKHHVTGYLLTAPSILRMTSSANFNMLSGSSTSVTKSGTTIKINEADIVLADVFKTNGMIHGIDTILMPPLDIIDTAVINGNFKTLRQCTPTRRPCLDTQRSWSIHRLRAYRCCLQLQFPTRNSLIF